MSIYWIALVPLTLAVIGGGLLGIAGMFNARAERRERNSERASNGVLMNRTKKPLSGA